MMDQLSGAAALGRAVTILAIALWLAVVLARWARRRSRSSQTRRAPLAVGAAGAGPSGPASLERAASRAHGEDNTLAGGDDFVADLEGVSRDETLAAVIAGSVDELWRPGVRCWYCSYWIPSPEAATTIRLAGAPALELVHVVCLEPAIERESRHVLRGRVGGRL